MSLSKSHVLTEESIPYRTNGEHPCNPLHCIDLFSGCGGLSLGLEQAGFEPLLFSEINLSAAQTYIANRVNKNIVPIGDVYTLSNENLDLLSVYWKERGINDIDLVCGGPPCQGYSGIGHRRTFKLEKKDIPSNHLYQEMARVIRHVKPRAFLFENVKGLLSARWSATGIKGELFKAVLNEFKSIPDYYVRWDLLHAKNYGVPQNRPRVMIVGIRFDVISRADQLALLDRAIHDGPSAVRDGFLPDPSGVPPSLEELLSDLEDRHYKDKLVTAIYPSEPKNPIQLELRRKRDGSVLSKGAPLTEQVYSDHLPYIEEKYTHMIKNGGEIPQRFQTKKFAQRVFPRTWDEGGPNITATSLPEDYVHYNQPRTPTVREWARIQTFPDWYQFRGPRTTGGRRRAGDPDAGIWDREVPRYTQIGNAVPVLLARKVGQHISGILMGKKKIRV